MASEADSDIGITKAAPELLDVIHDRFAKLLEGDETVLKALVTALDPFQGEPQLLDAYIRDWVTRLLQCYVQGKGGDGVFVVIYTLCKIRGYKVISRFFDSDVALLEEVVDELEQREDSRWEKRYVLLLWLSILILAPFSLETFGESMELRLYNLVLSFLDTPGKERDAACIVMARICTRGDVNLMPHFFEQMGTAWADAGVFYKLGLLQTTALILQFAAPKEIEPVLPTIFSLLANTETKVESTMFEKLLAKGLGRLALVYLSSSKSLDYLPDEVEDILGQLLELLGHRDTTVRYTASKAVARIAHKMDAEFQGEVIGALNAVFEENVIIRKDGTRSYDQVESSKWHGALLCIAELLRRNLLDAEEHFQDLCDILVQSLKFEQQRLTYAVGANVRDAGCYVAWSLFRVYKNVDKDILSRIFDALVNLCCFDREVNIRRAASAAIQEGVGRQGAGGSIEEGLELIQVVDYFCIGRRSNAFTKTSCQVYKLGYTSVLEYVVEKCINSWDADIRRLAGKAIRALADVASAHQRFFGQLYAMYSKLDFEIQHGVLVSLGDVLDGNIDLTKCNCDKVLSLLEGITDEELTEENELLNSEGFCHLLLPLLRAYDALKPSQQTRIDDLAATKLSLAMQNKSNTFVEDIKLIASLVVSPPLRETLIQHWTARALSNVGFFTVALGSLYNPDQSVFDALVKVVDTSKDMETKKEAVDGLGRITLETGNLSAMDSLVNALNDYTVDSRGDVGSWLREAAIAPVTKICIKYDATQHKPAVISRLLSMSVEVLDKLQKISLKHLNELYIDGPIHEILSTTPTDCSQFEYFSHVLKLFPHFNQQQQSEFIKGYLSSAGALQASQNTLQGSMGALTDYCHSPTSSDKNQLLKAIVQFVDVRLQGNKVTTHALNVVSLLLDSGYNPPEKFLRPIFVRAYNSHLSTRNLARITPAIRIMGALVERGLQEPVQRLLVLSKHPIPPVRMIASEVLYDLACLQQVIPVTDWQALQDFGNVDWVKDDYAPVVDALSAAINGQKPE
ncbi:hypothetical protein TRVA0_043S00540 [Trichomonascus vanleenenianus]|uniref:Cin1p n=1 Tax=Trichomonascus vanleenenianus TaxID=2268995 RepID=UPI003ECAE939